MSGIASAAIGQRIERGYPMGSPFGMPGTVSLDAFYGGVSGMTKGELSSAGPVRRQSIAGISNPLASTGSLLTLPVVLALGLLVWYAVKTY